MKVSKEIRIAIVCVATIVAFILVANFLKGKSILKPEQTYYAYYDNVDNLTSSSSVFFRGMRVGRVDKLEFVDPKNPRIKVTIRISERLEIPVNTIARVATADLMGTKIIELIFGDEQTFLKNGDTLVGEVDVDMMTKVTSILAPTQEKIEQVAASLDTLLTAMNAMFNDEAQHLIRSSIRNLDASLRNVRTLTTTAHHILNDERESLNKILTNFAKISEDLNEANIPNTVHSLQSTLAQTEQLIRNLKEGEGTAGLLLNDPKLYEELVGSAENLSKLLDDLQANPKRYVHFSLFGRKSN